MTVRYLDLADYAVVVQATLGLDEATVRSILAGPAGQLADSALAAPRAGLGGVEAYPTVPTKAAVLLERLVANHPLPNGNKRCAVVTTELFVRLNGHVLLASDNELEDLVWKVAEGAIDRETLAHHLRAFVAATVHSRPWHSSPGSR
ncbi:death-on-curing family protein [Acidimicrobium ferrooxidans DSM 10331]|uniref:Death-on-curing family protein n=1 Tax=Acidimicrobium ferrooxidans (strain DSM 10331 / JCM 15462 / NBRC 103882 / ICP) TaxID=525909 RepID=C7M0Q6_ACIFD|nr:type II toxin-antitoxin system death-on-curing family toxin [Acidimicrobium ferrooxidans]ACU54564.1 death-on-curing family protein [Acidimicrobium ferrooxidans DSM 10331]